MCSHQTYTFGSCYRSSLRAVVRLHTSRARSGHRCRYIDVLLTVHRVPWPCIKFLPFTAIYAIAGFSRIISHGSHSSHYLLIYSNSGETIYSNFKRSTRWWKNFSDSLILTLDFQLFIFDKKYREKHKRHIITYFSYYSRVTKVAVKINRSRVKIFRHFANLTNRARSRNNKSFLPRRFIEQVALE